MLSPRHTGLLLVALATVARLWLAFRWGALADEAYYWVWSRELALGYFDHPPGIAWLIAWAPPSAGWVRLPGIVLTSVGSGLLVDKARDPVLLAALLGVLPPLWLLGTLATPDAPLLGLWMIALAAVQRDRPGIAGGIAGIAVLAKYTALALLPLLLLGDPALRRDRRLWIGAGLGALCLAPHGVWSMAQGHPALAFQAEHGLGGDGLRWAGPLLVLGQQLGMGAGLLGLAALAWAGRGWRSDRLAWATSVPLVGFFALAALRAAPEANWPAPAWIGLALGLSQAHGRLRAAVQTGVWVALGLSLMAVAQVERPLVPLAVDPGARPHTGAAFARTAVKFVLPPGVEAHSEGAAGIEVLTERYQEAAWLRFHFGVDATVWPGCGRPSQLDGEAGGDAVLYLRPATGGPPGCVAETWDVAGRQRFAEHDPAARLAGTWDVIALERRR